MTPKVTGDPEDTDDAVWIKIKHAVNECDIKIAMGAI